MAPKRNKRRNVEDDRNDEELKRFKDNRNTPVRTVKLGTINHYAKFEFQGEKAFIRTCLYDIHAPQKYL